MCKEKESVGGKRALERKGRGVLETKWTKHTAKK